MGFFIRDQSSFFSPSKSVFGRGVELSNLRNLRKKVVHLYRSTRLLAFSFSVRRGSKIVGNRSLLFFFAKRLFCIPGPRVSSSDCAFGLLKTYGAPRARRLRKNMVISVVAYRSLGLERVELKMETDERTNPRPRYTTH